MQPSVPAHRMIVERRRSAVGLYFHCRVQREGSERSSHLSILFSLLSSLGEKRESSPPFLCAQLSETRKVDTAAACHYSAYRIAKQSRILETPSRRTFCRLINTAIDSLVCVMYPTGAALCVRSFVCLFAQFEPKRRVA